MPKRKLRRKQVRSSSPSRKQLMPFSLIFQPEELKALRKIADKEGVAIAAVIRRAIHTVIGRVHPEFEVRLLASEANDFLDQLATRFPGKMLTPSKRRKFRLQLVKDLK
jgi:hypothetical protein